MIGLFMPTFLQAQFYNGSQISFGKNRVQHQNFNWQYLRSDQYDVYYYPTGRALAQYVYYKVPEITEEIERLLNYTSNKKLQLIVYNTQADFRESNFAYDDEDFYNQGGVTNISGTKIYLYFDGNHAHLDRMIRSGIMNVYARWLAEGSSMGANISSDYLINVPSWFYSGLSSYFGERWNADIDAHVMDGILTQRYADIEYLSPVDATYAGHSFWKFVVDTYGEKIISRILHNTRSTKMVERSLYYSTGIPYRTLLLNWYKYYYVMYHQNLEKTQPADEGIIPRPRSSRHYQHVCFQPNGDGYAYVTNEAGQVKVWLQTGDRKRPKCIFKRYQKTEDNPDLSYPIINWFPTGEGIGLTLESKGHCYYYPYSLSEKKWEKRSLVDVEKITSWTFSNDGMMMLFSGFQNGQSDLFLYSFLSHSFQNLTNDFYDDYGPVFLNPQQIVFSSNRPTDSILLKDDFMDAKPQKRYDLFLYDYAKKDSKVMRATSTEYANEYDPCVMSGNQILYLSDKEGIVNRYTAVFDSTISRIDTAIHYAYFAKSSSLTDGAYSILDHTYNPATEMVADIQLKNKAERMYMRKLNPLYTPTVTPTKFHQKIIQAEQESDSLKQSKLDNASREKEEEHHGFLPVYSSDLDPVSTSENGQKRDSTKTENKERMEIPVGTGYRVQYSINKVITQADFSFLNTSYQQFEGGTKPIYLNTGINALFMLGIHDLFEDYRITAGIRFSFNLQNNEFMFSFENLSKRLDRQIVLYRQAIGADASDYALKQTSNSLFYILKFPFDKSNSLRLTLKGRYETNVVGSLSDNTLREPTTHHLWAGAKLEYVYDSSKQLFTNLWKGSKIKIFAEYDQRAERETQNLLVVGFDARHSFHLYKNMTLAFRAAASTNIGSARLVYFMGGVDNWVNAKFNSDIWVDQSKNYVYQTLATNMRGFRQNIRNGTSFVLFSGELRIPFVQLIAGHQVGLELFNSMQLNIFGDIGTAWTGLTPYSEENCLYTRYINNGPISIMIKRQVDPFVGGFGLGLRFSLIGYFLRFDYAWGVEDFSIVNKKGMFLFSIGTDF
ncbi:MAG: hypothetical protein J6S56_02100 [Bacteroidales bacterium]|nr:hypothetical protein [Bacteroidales bacterium]